MTARYANIKPLQSVWAEFPQYSARNTLLLDDSPEKAVANPQHTSVHPAPFNYERASDVPAERPAKLNKKAKKRKLLEAQAAGSVLVPPTDPRDALGSDDVELEPGGPLWRHLDAVADAAAAGADLEDIVAALGLYRSMAPGAGWPHYYAVPTPSTGTG